MVMSGNAAFSKSRRRRIRSLTLPRGHGHTRRAARSGRPPSLGPGIRRSTGRRGSGGSGWRATTPGLFSPWRIRRTAIPNRVVFPPTCPTWVDGAGVLTDMATEYYRERARGGVGLIIIGASHVHADSLAAPLLTPQLYDDANIEPLARVAEAVHAEGTKLAIQLWHSGVRGAPLPEAGPGRAARRDLVHPLPEPGAARRVSGRIDAEGDDRGGDPRPHRRLRRRRPARDGGGASTASSSTSATATSPGSSCRRSTTSVPTGGAAPTKGGSRFPVEAMNAIRGAIGREAFMGYRINSTSFWPGDPRDRPGEGDRPRPREEGRSRLRERLRRRSTTPSSTPRCTSRGAGRRTTRTRSAGCRRSRCSWSAGSPPPTSPEELLKGRPWRRHLSGPPALHRPRVGEQGAGGAGRTTSAAAWPRTSAGGTRPPDSACQCIYNPTIGRGRGVGG